MLSWMAWTWPTALVVSGIFSAIGVLILLEIRSPGGAARKGVLGRTTTRGERLFNTLLGPSYICMAGLGMVGMRQWSRLGRASAGGGGRTAMPVGPGRAGRRLRPRSPPREAMFQRSGGAVAQRFGKSFSKASSIASTHSEIMAAPAPREHVRIASPRVSLG